jgi:hypothetical protein
VRPAVPDEELVEEWAFAKSEVKHPPRIKLLDVLAQTEAAGIPAWIAAAMPDSGRLQMVLAFLHRLQDESYHKDDNFFISTRDLGSLFGGSRQWAMRALRMFCRRRIIEVVDRGGPHNQKATRFRFVPGRDGGAEW